MHRCKSDSPISARSPGLKRRRLMRMDDADHSAHGLPRCVHTGVCCLHGHHGSAFMDCGTTSLTRQQWAEWSAKLELSLNHAYLKRSSLELLQYNQQRWRMKNPRGRRIRPKRIIHPRLVSKITSFPFDEINQSIRKSTSSSSSSSSQCSSSNHSLPAVVSATDSSDSNGYGDNSKSSLYSSSVLITQSRSMNDGSIHHNGSFVSVGNSHSRDVSHPRSGSSMIDNEDDDDIHENRNHSNDAQSALATVTESKVKCRRITDYFRPQITKDKSVRV